MRITIVVLMAVGLLVYFVASRPQGDATVKGDKVASISASSEATSFCDRPKPTYTIIPGDTPLSAPDKAIASAKAIIADFTNKRDVTIKRNGEAIYGLIATYGTSRCKEAEPLLAQLRQIDDTLAENDRRDAARTPNFTLGLKDWRKGGFDSVGIVDVTISNSEKKPIKDISFACHFFAPSGTELNWRPGAIYETFAPASQRVVRNLNIGFIHSQTTKANCEGVGAMWAR